MANELLKQNYQDIADAIRSKTGSESSITPNEMPQAIENMTTTEDMEVFAPDTTKYYQSSYGYSFYYPSGQTLDMTEAEGTMFENTQTISAGFYSANSGDSIGYDGSYSPLEYVSGTVYEHSMELTHPFYSANTSSYIGYDNDCPLEGIDSFEVYEGTYYKASEYAQFAGNEYALPMISSKTLTNGALYMGLGKEFGYDTTLGYPTEELSIELFTMEVNDSQQFSVDDNGVTKYFTVTRTA